MLTHVRVYHCSVNSATVCRLSDQCFANQDGVFLMSACNNAAAKINKCNPDLIEMADRIWKKQHFVIIYQIKPPTDVCLLL